MTETIDQVIKNNKALVKSIALKFRDSGLDLDDLIQEGYIALARAFSKFNPDNETKFSTYAYVVVERALINVVEKYIRRVRFNTPEELATPVADHRSVKQQQNLVSKDWLNSLFNSAGLSDRDKRVMMLRFYSGLLVQEVAEEMGISKSTVKLVTHNSLVKIRRIMENTNG